MTTIFFAGGGTGGHLMPALAIADAMVRLDGSVRPFFLGSRRGIEANVLPQRPWPYELLPLEPLRRRQWWKNGSLPVSFVRSVLRVGRLCAEHRPSLVVGTGGYAAGPVVWSAARRGIPAVLQEQNAFPGLATRWLAGRAAQIHLGFPEARRHLEPGPSTEIVDSGNPILPLPDHRPNRRKVRAMSWGLSPEGPVVLVLGGSQGALAVNLAVEAALHGGLWPREVRLIWQTGAGTYDRFSKWDDRISVLVRPFIDPISDAYAAADCLVSRSGAMTLAEICAWSLPSVLVPLPTAAAGHQAANARALADAGAAVFLDQSDLTGQRLVAELAGLLSSPARLADISRVAGERARPDAADRIATDALGLLPRN
ncbi:MAG: undecaprenyldiphospho-muramoylpentapeptide beta-N-acetylglucosaminyltransferase [Gemmatimonadales bacterium]|nr:MAG: undecaprenyldiphospho-muramoylpentapeptide beta-N-acetylglucosaminyltransferase [Gemmatimonadales bacterium]